MAAKTYAQNCGLAQALDVLGGRWTFLVIRELAVGPRRFKDLTEALPGMGTNLVASRLRSLEDAGVVRRAVLPPPSSVNVYELTEIGQRIPPILQGLALWGLENGTPYVASARSKALWILQSMVAAGSLRGAESLGMTVEFVNDDETHWIRCTPEGIELRQGVSPFGRDLSLRSTADILFQIAAGNLDMADAVADAGLIVEGDVERARQFFSAFAISATTES